MIEALKNGDYLPASEIKTEQDFNDVVKAAENCGFKQSIERSYKEFKNVLNSALGSEAHEIWGSKLLLVGLPIGDNKLTLTEWLDRSGVVREQISIEKSDSTLTANSNGDLEVDIDGEKYQSSDDGKTWFGEGLPPVGVECLAEDCDGWEKTLIVGFDSKGRIVCETPWDMECDFGAFEKDSNLFKPLPSKQDIAREKFIDEVSILITDADTYQSTHGGQTIATAKQLAEMLYKHGCRMMEG